MTGRLIVKCKDNNGIGDCPYRKYCLAHVNDSTITGCTMPFVWAGMIDKSDAVVEYTVKQREKE